MSSPAKSGDTDIPAEEMEKVSFEIQEVRYSLPMMLRELQIERTQSYFAKEIIDQVEINKIFAQARKTRAKRKK